MKKLSLFALFASLIIIVGCSSELDNDSEVINDSDSNESYDSQDITDTTDTYDEVESDSPYTKEELENDPYAPSTNPNDYNENGEYVPENGLSDNPADYNADGEYKPIEDMTQDEIQAELESMFEKSLDQ